MKFILQATTVSLGLALLAACGGSGTSATVTPDLEEDDFAGMARKFSDLLEVTGFDSGAALGEASASELTTTADLPMPGEATFTGQMALTTGTLVPAAAGSDAAPEPQDVEFLLGDVELNIDFTAAGGSFTGGATGFQDLDSNAHSGTLAFEDGDVIQGTDGLRTERLVRLGLAPTNTDPAVGLPAGEDNANGTVSDFAGTLTAPDGTETDYDGLSLGVFTGVDANLVGVVQGNAGETNRVFEGFFVTMEE